MATDELNTLLIVEECEPLLGALNESGVGDLSHGKQIRSEDRELTIGVAALLRVEGFIVRCGVGTSMQRTLLTFRAGRRVDAAP